MNCQTCTDPTKHPIGFWDGENTHGQLFDCHNHDCEAKQSKQKLTELLEEERVKVVEENSRNNIQMLLIKMKRKELQITISMMAKSLGISPSDYSNYEMCRVALPVEMVGRIEGVFREREKLIIWGKGFVDIPLKSRGE